MAATKKTNEVGEVHPVKSLKEHIVTLDAAMLVAVTAAEVGAVHKLRTATRRVEAHLHLVDLLEHATRPSDIPEHTKEAKAVQRRLRTVRQAAGKVRDLDVQVDAIWYDAPAKTEEKGAAKIAEIRYEAKTLRKSLSHSRELEAAKLIGVLKTEQRKLAASLRELEQAMKPASVPAIEPDTMITHIQQWFTGETLKLLAPDHKSRATLKTRISRLDEDALHSFRKAAKLCRYMAESAPEESPVLATAEQFEALQEAGGKWHDWLLLARLARKFHGRDAALTRRYSAYRDAALREYQAQIEQLMPVLSNTAAA